MKELNYTLSENQKLFVIDAIRRGHDIDYGYSGRFMYGRKCPSIIVNSLNNLFVTEAKVTVDNMGLNFVLYAKD